MELRTMYPPQKDSPTTFLLGAISSTDTFAIVGNAGLLPQVCPYPLTIGPDRPITETVMVTEIDLPTNRITFTRGVAAMPWSAGTTLGRVFTAQDLKTVQDNIVDIYDTAETAKTNVTNLSASVATLETIVGDSSNGLVKDLADEINRAKLAESAEVTRATTAEENLETKKINRTELPQIIIDASYSADATKLKTTLTRYNASNQETGNYERIIPLITTDSVGLMTPEAYNEITALRNDVMALQQQGGKFIGISFDTKATLDSYVVPSNVKVGDFTYVIDDEDHADSTTRYVFNGAKFDFAFVVNYDPVGLANAQTPGLVKSTDGSVEGKVFVETDGTMSTVGWDELTASVLMRNNDLEDVIANVIPLDADLFNGQSPSYYATKQSVDGLGGIGRTTETVKGNADALAAHRAEKASQEQLGHVKAGNNIIIDSIKNKLGDIIYPKTLTKAVYEVGTNKRLDVKITEIDDRIGSLNGDIESINLNKADKIEIPDITGKMDKSGGTFTGSLSMGGNEISNANLSSYTEELVDIGYLGSTFDLSLGNIFITKKNNQSYTIQNAKVGANSFTVIFDILAAKPVLTFPANVKWRNGEIPDLTDGNKVHIITFVTTNSGATWLGMFGGEF